MTSASFTDTQTHIYKNGINYLQDKGVVTGYDGGSFQPNQTINRAEFTKIIVGSIATSAELKNCKTQYFTDVAPDAWFAQYVCVAKKKGIIDGYDDGTFKPAQNINFSEAAKIIGKIYGSNFTATDPWYETYVSWLDDNNAIPLTIVSFNKSITRGEMAEITWRVDAKNKTQPSMVYKNNRLIKLATNSSSSTLSSEQRLLYVKICHSRVAYQKFEDCMVQMVSQK